MNGSIPYDSSNEIVLTSFLLEWDSLTKDTLEMLVKSQEKNETYWPRDTMFMYLQCMESFLENQAEFQELSSLARKQLLELHDS